MNIAIVTGASSGMGKEFVMQLSRYVTVDEIWVIARREDALRKLAGQVDAASVRPIALDLCKAESFETLSQLLRQYEPDLKLLVNAAGFGKFGDFQQIPLQADLDMIELNCKALVAMTRTVLPYMHRGSHILQLDSLSAFQPVPYITTYGATKAFVLSYSRAIGQELRPQGIRVMAMNPAWVRTEFFDRALQTNDSKVQYFNYIYDAKDVVATGLRHLYRTKKDCSIHGLPVKLQVLLVKLLPHTLVMRTWLNQQKTPKNTHSLTPKT